MLQDVLGISSTAGSYYTINPKNINGFFYFQRHELLKSYNGHQILELLAKAGIQLTYYHPRQIDNKLKKKAKGDQDQDEGDPYKELKRIIYAFGVAEHKYGFARVL